MIVDCVSCLYVFTLTASFCLSDFSQEEIQQLKLKLEKVEKERNELRLNTDRLESRVNCTNVSLLLPGSEQRPN